MTQILFLIGNGFDLNIGLKTSFKDVLNEYLKIETEDDSIKQFQKEIDKNFENWSDFEKEMGKYTKEFTKDTVDNYLHQTEHFQNFLIQQFKLEERRIDYTKHQSHIISIFRESLTKFNKNLSGKDKQIISPFISSSANNAIRYNFIIFNYTKILDRCLEIIGQNDKFSSYNHSIGKKIHIHGTLEKEMILGIDNISQIANEEVANDTNFQWNLVKPIINKELKNNNDDEAKDLINSASVICIFGMSIGETDTTWWKCIYNWLESATDHYLIIFYYDAEIDKANPREIIKKVKNTKKSFFSLIGVTDDKGNQYEDKIIVAPQNNMFKMDIVSSGKETYFTEAPND